MTDVTPCECGCGSAVRPGSRFVHGHNRRGVAVPESTRAKMSASAAGKPGELSNSFGAKRSPETKAKQR